MSYTEILVCPSSSSKEISILQVANLACSMSNNEEGVKLVRMAADQIDSLCSQVINAARVLAARPRSKVALENMDVFKDAWEVSRDLEESPQVGEIDIV